jgi:hypothetical protein
VFEVQIGKERQDRDLKRCPWLGIIAFEAQTLDPL